MKSVAIRVDGSSNMGMGHIFRCLSLADAFAYVGVKVIFISKYIEGIKEIEKKGYQVIKLDTKIDKKVKGVNYGKASSLDKEAEEILNIVEKENINVLIIDHYNVNEEFFFKLSKINLELVYIDDMNLFEYSVDMVINGNISAHYMGYREDIKRTQFLLGLKYNMIRSEFRHIPKKRIDNDISTIMITMGGADPYNLSPKFAEWMLRCSQYKDKKIMIVVGSAFENVEEIVALTDRYSNIVLYSTDYKYIEYGYPIQVVRMSEIMVEADIAIAAGGGTLYELCACGTVPFSCIIADNQLLIVEAMCEQGYSYNLGWYDDITEEKFVDIINRGLEKEQLYPVDRQEIVDGEGCKRIVDNIMKYTKK